MVATVPTAIHVEVLPARLGDCLLVECPRPDGTTWRMLVDGGPPDTWPLLEARLRRLDPDDRHIDVAVITHIDSDHIGGMLPFLASDLAADVRDFWFNGRTHLPVTGPGRPRSVDQGESLVAALRGPDEDPLAGGPRRCSHVAEPCRGTSRSVAGPSTRARRAASSRLRCRVDRPSRCSHRRRSASCGSPTRGPGACATRWATTPARWRSTCPSLSPTCSTWPTSGRPGTRRCPTAAASPCSSSTAGRASCSGRTPSGASSPRPCRAWRAPAGARPSPSTR